MTIKRVGRVIGATEVLEGAPTSVPFDILHDPEKRVASAFGLTFELPESHRKLLQMLNVDVAAANGDGSYRECQEYCVRGNRG